VCVDVDDPVKGTVQLNMNFDLMYMTDCPSVKHKRRYSEGCWELVLSDFRHIV